jgi:hypothetical protein
MDSNVDLIALKRTVSVCVLFTFGMEVSATPLTTQNLCIIIRTAMHTLHLSRHIAIISVQNNTNLIVVKLPRLFHCKSYGMQNLILVLQSEVFHVGNKKLDEAMEVHVKCCVLNNQNI